MDRQPPLLYDLKSPMDKKLAEAPRYSDITEVLTQSDPGMEILSDELAKGDLLDDYVIDRILGSGGAGIVYAAHHRETGEPVALKQLRTELVTYDSMLTRFVREAEASTKIGHPNIVHIRGFGGVQQQRPYYVMEMLNGLDLRKTCEAEGRFSPRAALEVLAPVCEALQAAHDVGIVHRDIKSSNIMIGETNGVRTVKLLDFGIAKMLYRERDGERGITQAGTMMGTAHNMAPEQVRAESVDGRADIYALGVVLFQLVTGQYPFNAPDSRQIALMHLQQPPPRPSLFAPLSPALDAVILRCLEKQPAKRFQSAMELLNALRAAVDEAAPAQDAATRGLGLFFEVHTASGEEINDEMFDDVTMIMDTVEMTLLERGFQLPLRGSDSLLGVRVLEDGANVDSERADAEGLARELLDSLQQRDGAHPDVRIRAALRVDEIARRGVEVTGGALLKTGTWTAQDTLR